MNENEAIEQLRNEYLVSLTGKETPASVRYHNEALDTAIAALKEVQEYHATGHTPKMVRGLISGYNKMEQKCRNYKMVEMIRCQGLCDTAKLLEELKKYQAIGTPEQCQEAVDRTRWILVSERLPEEEGRYLVTFRSECKYYLVGYGNCRMSVLEKEIGYGWYDLHDSVYFDGKSIIAWMPLPEPYHITNPDKKEGDDE